MTILTRSCRSLANDAQDDHHVAADHPGGVLDDHETAHDRLVLDGDQVLDDGQVLGDHLDDVVPDDHEMEESHLDDAVRDGEQEDDVLVDGETCC